MRIFLFYFFASILFFSKSFGQLTPSDKHILDSLLENDALLKMINDFDNPSSYFRINVGIANKLFTNQNKAIQSLQNINQLVISPSAGYYHKSGLSISFAGFLFSENKKTDFYQYALSPSYSYLKGNDIYASISYTHYFLKNIYSSNTSPVQDVFYGSLIFKKPWLRPGISAGYSMGTYHEIIRVDTIVRIGNQQAQIKFIDTLATKISVFSLIGTLEHSFLFYRIFSKKNGLIFTPQLSLITGINTYQVSHRSSTELYNTYTQRLSKRTRYFQSRVKNDQFKLQSIGLDLDVNYFIGKFYMEPELYIDYYLPKTDEKKFTQIFNFNIGITF